MKIHAKDSLGIIVLVISGLLTLNIFIQANLHKYPDLEKQPFLVETVKETNKPADSAGLSHKIEAGEEAEPILNLELRGTIIGQPSLAFIYNSASDTHKVCRLNDAVEDFKIVNIVPAKVILERNGNTLELLLSGQNRKYAQDEAYQKVVMSRFEMLGELPNVNKLLSKIKILPSHEPGSDKLNGFRIDNIPAGSIIEKAGIKSGDIIHSVQGNVLESMPDAWRIFNAVRNQPRIEVVLLRGNTPVTLSYEIRN